MAHRFPDFAGKVGGQCGGTPLCGMPALATVSVTPALASGLLEYHIDHSAGGRSSPSYAYLPGAPGGHAVLVLDTCTLSRELGMRAMIDSLLKAADP